jgi:hypothetical protein
VTRDGSTRTSRRWSLHAQAHLASWTFGFGWDWRFIEREAWIGLGPFTLGWIWDRGIA